jgi:TonB family protein
LKGPAPSGRRPAGPAEPLPEDEAATVVVRGQGRGGARPARAAEPESDEPSTVVMQASDTRADRPGLSTAPRGVTDRAPTPPPIGRPPAGPPDETVTAPSPVIPGPRRSTLTLALGGVGLIPSLVLLTTALVVIRNWRPAPSSQPPPSPSVSPIRTTTPAPPIIKGVVHVESTPMGASVSIDGKRVGTTPMDIHDLSLASHEVKVELEGYAPVTESVMLTPEVPRTEFVKTLTRTQPATGMVDVTSTPAGGMVKIDGTSVGLTPLRAHKVNVGSHRIEITADGYEPFAARVRVTEGATAALSPSLVPKQQVKPTPKPTPTAPLPPTPDPTVYDENSPLITTKPVKTIGKSAEYPKDAAGLKRGQRASVTVSFVVLESGDVTDVQIVESAGATVDDAVAAAYKSWKYTPGMKQGAKVKVRVTRRQTFLGG